MKQAVLISIQPYYVFLIIARLMGWDIPQEKTIEVRKDFPKYSDWNKKTLIYCSKNRKSFKQIPEQYQPFMAKLMGKVIGEFVCDKIYNIPFMCSWDLRDYDYSEIFKDNDKDNYFSFSCTGLLESEIFDYGKGKDLYGLHISDLKIYDKPKELGELRIKVNATDKRCLGVGVEGYWQAQGYDDREETHCLIPLTRPPQSWCYVEVNYDR